MKIHNIFPISVMEFKIPLDPKKIKEDLDKYKNIMERPPLFSGDGEGISSYNPDFSILKNDEFIIDGSSYKGKVTTDYMLGFRLRLLHSTILRFNLCSNFALNQKEKQSMDISND